MKAYSDDLRSRVIKAYKEGECWSDVCEMYQIAKSTLYEWLKGKQYSDKLKEIDLSKIVYLDECGIDDNKEYSFGILLISNIFSNLFLFLRINSEFLVKISNCPE